MKNKLISVGIMFICVFTSLIVVDAIAPTPRIDLDEYQITTADKNNVYISGTINISKGQDIGIYDSNEKIMYASVKTNNTNGSSSFKLHVPARYLTESTNTFKVKSTPIKNIINGSNPKTLTVKITSVSKKNQTITCSNTSLSVSEQKNLNAKVSSNLPLTYKSDNATIATVDYKGNITARKVGTTKVTITQSGNFEYNAVSKTVTITVTNKTSTNTSKVSLSKVKVSGINSKYTWLSKAVKPVPTVKYGDKKLKQNVDYTLAYSNNKEPGTGKVIITGKGKYEGTINKTFLISIEDTRSIKPKKGKSDYKVITLSGRTFKLYKQGGASYSGWKFNYNNKSTIRGNGCGPVSIADIMSGYGYDMHPGQVAKDATKYAVSMHKKDKNIKKSCKGKNAWGRYLRHYGFNAIVHTNVNESDKTAEKNIRNALNKGHQVFLQVGKGSKKWRKFTASGWHNIALLGIDKTGKYAYVANSSGSAKKWCKISDLAKGRLKYKNRKYGYIEIWKPVD